MDTMKLGQRRVQNIAGTVFISLPKIWTRNIGIKKGDRLDIDLLDDGSLRISQQEEA